MHAVSGPILVSRGNNWFILCSFQASQLPLLTSDMTSRFTGFTFGDTYSRFISGGSLGLPQWINNMLAPAHRETLTRGSEYAQETPKIPWKLTKNVIKNHNFGWLLGGKGP